jgi:choline dehydrogenase-like flavoprotein
MSLTHDVIVVGSGACGALAARLLTTGGLDVALVEAGPRAPESEPDRAGQQLQSQCLGFHPRVRHLYVDDSLHPYTTPPDRPFVWIRGRQVGGRTHQWGLGALRWGRAEFEQVWPMGYDEMVPHYREVESLLGVRGGADAVGEPSDSAAPQARELGAAERELAGAVARRWPGRRVVIFPYAEVRVDHATHLLRRWLEAEPTSETTSGRFAAGRGRLTIRTDTIVEAIHMAAGGRRATGVRVVNRVDRARSELSARYVVLCASTLESTRILLNSGGPAGLANSSGMLGQFLADHLWGIGVGAVAERPACRIDRQRHPPLLIPPFHAGDDARLSKMQLVCGLQGGDDGRAYLRIDAHGQAESRRENRVLIDRSIADAWGVPALRIEYARTAADRELAQAMLAASLEVAAEAGFSVLRRDDGVMPPGLSVHELGTARMGREPATSIVNPHCQCWDVPNLLVCDGSVFPSAGVQNPTLTMMAITSWACSHLLRAAS